MRRTWLVWCAVLALVAGGIAWPAQALDAPAEARSGMGGGETLRALPVTLRAQGAHAQAHAGGGGAAPNAVLWQSLPAWRALRALPDAPPTRPVPIVPSDPEAPGTGAALG